MTDPRIPQHQFYIKIDGQRISPDLQADLEELTIENSLHLPDVATIVFHDEDLRRIDDNRLAPGHTVEIATKSGSSDEEKFFDGEIVEVEPEYAANGNRLLVRAFDRLHRLARGRHTRSFLNVTDGDLVQKIAQECGLKCKVGETPTVYPYVLQANETNLEFLRRRAARYGYMLFVDGTTLYFDEPKTDDNPVEMRLHETLAEFRPRLTTIDQMTKVTARGWDPEQKRAVVGQAQNGKGVPSIGDTGSGGAVAQGAFKIASEDLVVAYPLRDQNEAQRLAQAIADRHASRFIEADGVAPGNPKVIAGVKLQISGVGTRFSGTYYVTSTTHEYGMGDEGYTVRFAISGLNPATLLSTLTPDPDPLPTGGLVIGIVTDNQDPMNQGRVKVKYPWLTEDHASDWARVVAVGGGDKRGIQFLPEVNDEVLIGFEQGDIHYPYVLGGLWNGQDAPPKPSSEVVKGGHVQQRIIRSRAGHEIVIDDDDAGGGITIVDKNGNKIQLDTASGGLTIETRGDVKIKSQSNFSFEAQGNVSISATGKAEVKGMGVTLDAGGAQAEVKGAGVSVNGAGNVDIKGTGTVDIKGGLIKLN